MSTNYYWKTPRTAFLLPTEQEIVIEAEREDPLVHIGKSSAVFYWAQEPRIVRRVCELRPDDHVIVDEYGREWTGQEFLDMVAAYSDKWYHESIGTWFS